MAQNQDSATFSPARGRRLLNRLMALVVTGASLALASACGGAEGPVSERQGTRQAGGDTETPSGPTIKLIVKPTDGREPYVVEVRDRSESETTASASGPSGAGAQSSTKGPIAEGPSEELVSSKEQQVKLQDEDGLLKDTSSNDLAYWVANSCRERFAKVAPISTPIPIGGPHAPTTYFPAEYAHELGTSGVFRPMLSCDDVLVLQQQLLCMAQTYAEGAEGLNTQELYKSETNTVLLPPQATSDRVLLRRMELEVLLGFVTITQSRFMVASNTSVTCQDAYVNSLNATYSGTTPPNSSPFYAIGDVDLKLPGIKRPPVALNSSTGAGLTAQELDVYVAPRARLMNRQMAAAGEMIHDAIERGLSDVLATAETASSPSELWGLDAESAGRSLRTALALVLGRVELDSSTRLNNPASPPTPSTTNWTGAGAVPRHYNDPSCRGYVSLADMPGEKDLLNSLGTGFAYRLQEVAPATLKQQRARDLIASLGLVRVPSGGPGSGTYDISGAALAPFVREQAIRWRAYSLQLENKDEAAIQAGTATVTSAEVDAMIGKAEMAFGSAIDLALQDLSPEDLEYGFQAAANLVEQIAGADQSGTSPLTMLWSFGSAPFGMFRLDSARSATAVASKVWVISAHSVRYTGLDRALRSSDVAALTAPAAAVGACNETGLSGTAWTGTSAAASNARAAMRAGQNPYHLGYELAVYAGTLSAVLPDAGLEDIPAKAQELTSALRGWAGYERVQLDYGSPTTRTLRVNLPISVFGKDLLTANTPTSLMDVKVVTAEGPEEAECIAGLRTICPSPSALASATWAAGTVVSATLGSTNPEVDLKLSFTSPNQDADADADVPGKLNYVVLVRKGRPGMVLAAFPPSKSPSLFSRTSVHQRAQLEKIFATRARGASADSCLDSNEGDREEYGGLGIRRNQYIPVANELTSSSGGEVEDSWKHYLALARASADEADALGQQIIDLGLQKDMRAEAAQEDVVRLCGAASLDGVSIGSTGASAPSNGQLSQCLAPEMIDVLSFSAIMEKAPEDPEAFRAMLHESGGYCDTVQDATLCNAPTLTLYQPGTAASLTSVASLGFKPAVVTSAGSSLGSQCDYFLGAQGSLLSNYLERRMGTSTSQFEATEYQELSNTEELQAAGVIGALSAGQFSEAADGTWAFRVSGSVVLAGLSWGTFPIELGTTAATAEQLSYPLCKNITKGGTSVCDERALQLATKFGWKDSQKGISYMNLVRETIESGIVHGAVLTGQLPAGAIRVQVPVTHLNSDTSTAHFSTLYGLGRLTNGKIPVSDVYLQTDTSFGSATSMTSQYQTYHSTRRNVLFNAGDSWMKGLKAVYSPTDAALFYRDTSNQSTAFIKPGWGDPGLNDFYQGVLFGATRDPNDKASPLVASYDDVVAALHTGLQPAKHELVVNGRLFSEFVFDDDGILTEDPNTPIFDYLMPLGAEAGQNFRYHGSPACLSGPGLDNGLMNRTCLTQLNRDASSQALNWEVFHQASPYQARSYQTRLLLSPTVWPPEKRAAMFLYPGLDGQQGMVGMALVSCLARGASSLAVPREVPVVTKLSDLPGLRAWIDAQAQIQTDLQSKAFLPNVPAAILEYFQNQQSSNATVSEGEFGAAILQMATAFEQIFQAYEDLASGFRQMGSAVGSAELGLQGIQLEANVQAADLALARINNMGTIASALSSAAQASSGLGVETITSGAGAASALNFAAAAMLGVQAGMTFAALDDKDAAQQALNANGSAVILQNLGQEVQAARDSVQASIGRMRDARLQALNALNSLASLQAAAGVAVAKATGAPFADLDGDGAPDLALPVNQVLQVQYDSTKIRYDVALLTAKRYAYMAQLAIEQRLGVRLETLAEPIGPMAAPSSWVPKLPALTGVDYTNLTVGPDDLDKGGTKTEDDIVAELAGQWIGDYVNQLEEFMEFYNVAYPFHEEDDAVVLSLRDDLVYGDGLCPRESRNLLYHSQNLDRAPSGLAADEAPSELSLRGWTRLGNSSTHGLVVSPFALTSAVGAATPVYEPIEGPDGEVSGTLLAAPVAVASSGPATPEIPKEPVDPTKPSHAVYQSLYLNGGTYVTLSWWDQARTVEGRVSSATSRLRVHVADEAWQPIALESFDSVPSPLGTEWSERRFLHLVAPADGYYHVVFTPGDAKGVAIANVQLEVAPADGPSPYEPTSDVRTVSSATCGKGDPAAFRRSFDRVCEDGLDCYYELRKPIFVSEGAIADGSLGLTGLAANNYNYRHTSLALNIIGTGVRDCSSQTQGCNAQQFVSYDLTHSAFGAELVDYAGESRCFNFGEGKVNHGKALTSERYLSTPLSSTDASLIQQDAFMQEALRGRPLSGQYRLRIYDQPGLMWDKVEDIQILLNHRYWSRVSTAN